LPRTENQRKFSDWQAFATLEAKQMHIEWSYAGLQPTKFRPRLCKPPILLVVWGRPSAQGEYVFKTVLLYLPVGGKRESTSLKTSEGEDAEKVAESIQDYNGVFSSYFTIPAQSSAAALQSNTEQQQRQHPSRIAVARQATMSRSVPTPWQHQQQETGQSIRDPNVNTLPLDIMFRVATVVQQIMTEFCGAVSEEDQRADITITVLKLTNQTAC
jgi:hypothetical protein